jgi:Flp pilus assembly protein TadD
VKVVSGGAQIVLLACALLPASSSLPKAQAQTRTHTGTPVASPAAVKRTANSSAQDDAAQASKGSQQPATPRERRAQAYAKLLEGQRYLLNARRNDTESIKLAQQAFQQAALLDPTIAEAHTALAEIAFFSLQDLTLAAREAGIAAGIDRDNLGAHRLLSRIHSIKSGMPEGRLDKSVVERAIVELREVARLYPSDAESWALLGEFYLATGRSLEAIDALTHWSAAPPATDTRIFSFITNGRELSPDAAAARLGEALTNAGRTTEAIAAIRRAISLNPDNKEYLLLLNSAFEADGSKDAGALAELQRMVTADPTNTTALQLLARAKARNGHVEEAVELLRARLNGSIEDFNYHLMISYLYNQAGRGNEAVAAARKALELAPASRQEMATNALLALSSAQERAGDAKGSEESLRRILSKEPDNATALNNLGYFLVERNERLDEALEMIQHAVRVEPANPSFLDSLGWAFFKLGRFEEAERNLIEAARLDQTSAAIQEHLGDIYRKRGKNELARAAWQKALSLSFAQDETTRIKAKINGH